MYVNRTSIGLIHIWEVPLPSIRSSAGSYCLRPEMPLISTIKPLLITQEWRDVGSDLAARRASRRANFSRDGPADGSVPGLPWPNPRHSARSWLPRYASSTRWSAPSRMALHTHPSSRASATTSITHDCWLIWRVCAPASRPISHRRAPSHATSPN